MLTLTATEPAHVMLRLPLPPSSNRLWRVGKGGVVYKSDAYRRWLQTAGWECIVQRAQAGRIPGRYHLRLTVPEQAKDLDNAALKAINDLLQQQRIVSNDKLCRRLGVQVDPARDASTLLVEAWAVEG